MPYYTGTNNKLSHGMGLVLFACYEYKVEQKQATETVGAQSLEEGGVLDMVFLTNFSHLTLCISV